MAHVAKYTKVSSGKLMAHYDRRKVDGKYIKFGNTDIDTTKSHLNYNLAPGSENQFKILEKRLSEIYVFKRADVKVMADWAVTLPKYFPRDKEQEFFEKSYNFLSERYGEENVISSYVHVDETTPHMHFSFVPVVFDKKKERYKLSAKEKLNVMDLRTFHKDLELKLSSHFEFEVGVLNGATLAGNKSITDLKLETAMEKLEVTMNELKYAKSNLESSGVKIIESEKLIDELREKIDAIEPVTKFVDEVSNIEVQVPIFKKDYITIKKQDYELLRDKALQVPKTALDYSEMLKDHNYLIKKWNTAQSEIKTYDGLIDSYKHNISTQKAQISLLTTEKSVLEDYIDNADLKFNIKGFKSFKKYFEINKSWVVLDNHISRIKMPYNQDNFEKYVKVLVDKFLAKDMEMGEFSETDKSAITKLALNSLEEIFNTSLEFVFNAESNTYVAVPKEAEVKNDRQIAVEEPMKKAKRDDLGRSR